MWRNFRIVQDLYSKKVSIKMKDRIAQIMKEEQLTAVQFAKETGIQQASLSHILNGRNNPSLEIVKKIHQRFSYINLDWLLYGEGTMKEPSGKEAPLATLFGGDESDAGGTENPKHAAGRAGTAYAEEVSRPIVKEIVKYVEKPSKKIVEIRVFFDDGTYETMLPQK